MTRGMVIFQTSISPDNWSRVRLQDHQLWSLYRFGRRLGRLASHRELAEHKVEDPEEVVKVGQELEVKVLRVDTDERKIGLSLKRVDWGEEQERAAAEAEAAEASGNMPAAEGDLKGGLGSGEGPLIPTGE